MIDLEPWEQEISAAYNWACRKYGQRSYEAAVLRDGWFAVKERKEQQRFENRPRHPLDPT